MRRIPTITLLDAIGAETWSGSLHDFGRSNGREVVADVVSQFRQSLDQHGRHEPAFVGGGAAAEFAISLVEAP